MDYRRDYGSWALVIGGSTTVGEQFARQLGAHGMNVAVVARRADKLERIAVEIREQHGVQTRSIPLDLMDEDAVEQLVEQTADLEVGLLIVNANLHRVQAFHTMAYVDKLTMLRLNYELPVRLAHHYGAPMVERRRGGIVFVNVLNSLTPIEVDAVFQGTKAGLRIFAESLWLEYRKHGVRVGVALVNGIEGSESYEAKLSPGRRRFAKLIGGSLSPQRIAAQSLAQLARGKPVLVPDGVLFTSHWAVKAFDLSRFVGGRPQLRLWSRVFAWFLDGDDVRGPPPRDSD